MPIFKYVRNISQIQIETTLNHSFRKDLAALLDVLLNLQLVKQ